MEPSKESGCKILKYPGGLAVRPVFTVKFARTDSHLRVKSSLPASPPSIPQARVIQSLYIERRVCSGRCRYYLILFAQNDSQDKDLLVEAQVPYLKRLT